MPSSFTDEEYSAMAFVYGFCNGNGRTAVAEYWHRTHITEHLKPYAEFCCSSL